MVSWIDRRKIIIDMIKRDCLANPQLVETEFIDKICLQHGCTPRKAKEYLQMARAQIKFDAQQVESVIGIVNE